MVTGTSATATWITAGAAARLAETSYYTVRKYAIAGRVRTRANAGGVADYWQPDIVTLAAALAASRAAATAQRAQRARAGDQAAGE